MTTTTIDYSRKWHVMAAVAMSVFLATIDTSIVNVALPTLVRDLQTDFAIVQWVVLAYLLTLATLMLGVGRLGDMVGKKRIYTSGFMIFTLGSVLAGLSPTIYWLIGFRVLQAVGAAMVLALGIAILTEAFPPSERGRALGIIGAVVSIGIVIGPTLGGLLIDVLSWHWIFFVNLPVGVIGTLAAIWYVPDIKPAGGQRFDFRGAITLFVSLLSLCLALTMGQRIGFDRPMIWLLFALWVVFLGVFVVIETRSDQPMIDLRLFRNRLFSINLITGLATFIAVAGALILMPFYLENVLGFGTRQVGLLLAAVPIGLGVTAPISGSLSDRLGTRPITFFGLLILFGGYYALGTLDAQTSVPGYLLRFIPIGIGMGVFQSPNNSAIMGAAPAGRLGVASGLLAITRTLGQITGVSTLGAFWAARAVFHSPEPVAGGATAAPVAAQVSALHDTFVVTVLLMLLALALSLWGLLQERRGQRMRMSAESGNYPPEDQIMREL